MDSDNQNEEVVEEKETTETPTESSTPQKANSFPVAILVIALLVVVGVIAFKGMKTKPSDDSSTAVEQISSPSPAATQTPSGPVKEFTVSGSNFKFSPSKITVKKGDNVKITFKDDDGMHNLVVDGYNVQTNTIKSGDSDSVTFLADKTGTFTYYCAVDSHRQKGMTGTLVVQ